MIRRYIIDVEKRENDYCAAMKIDGENGGKGLSVAEGKSVEEAVMAAVAVGLAMDDVFEGGTPTHD